MSDNAQLTGLCDRFRGFYPVVIDVETAGFNAKTDALLEIAAITLKMDEQGWLMPDTTLHFHVEPFVGANLQPEALARRCSRVSCSVCLFMRWSVVDQSV